jgi:hypothetical protein
MHRPDPIGDEIVAHGRASFSGTLSERRPTIAPAPRTSVPPRAIRSPGAGESTMAV